MIKKCLECGKEFKTRRDYSKFCSLDCKAKHQRLKDIPCAVCGKMFHPSKSTVKTCSKECGYKSMSLGDRECEYCGKAFTPEHNTNRFCSRRCGVMANTHLTEIPCPICGVIFKPRNSKRKCCSIHCEQIYNRQNRSDEEKQNEVKRLISIKPEVISKINRFYEGLLNDLGYTVELEFCLKTYSYDLKVGNVLIELNPFAYHNSSWAPNIIGAKPKNKLYHYNKVKTAIDNGYNIIMGRDWMDEDEIIKILQNLKQTVIEDSPILHWYNPKTKKHLIDNGHDEEEMLTNGYVKIYDGGEKYIFNNTKLN